MGSMSGNATLLDAVVHALITWGPPVLAGSVILFAAFVVAVGRRAGPVVLAAVAGAVLYWGMYVQSSLPVMYGSIAAGMATWVALLLRLARAPGARGTA